MNLWLHIKTNVIYEMLGEGKLEATSEELVAYRSTATGQLWFRPPKEFYDGRFQRVYKSDRSRPAGLGSSDRADSVAWAGTSPGDLPSLDFSPVEQSDVGTLGTVHSLDRLRRIRKEDKT